MSDTPPGYRKQGEEGAEPLPFPDVEVTLNQEETDATQRRQNGLQVKARAQETHGQSGHEALQERDVQKVEEGTPEEWEDEALFADLASLPPITLNGRVIKLDDVADLASLGMSGKQIGRILGFNPICFNHLKRKHARLYLAFEKGRADGIRTAASKLRERIEAGDADMVKFYLKSVGQWKEATDTAAVSGGVGNKTLVINL